MAMGQSSHSASRAGVKPTFAGLVRPALRVVEFALIIAITYVLARVIWLIAFGASASNFELDPAGSNTAAGGGSSYVADLTRLRDARLFADRRSAPDLATAVETIPETQLNLTLHGVRRGASTDEGSAIIQTPDQGQRFVAVGMEIIDGVTLDEVHVEYVIINRRGVTEALYLREETGRGALRRPTLPAADSTAPTGGFELDTMFNLRPAYEGDALVGYEFAGGGATLLGGIGLRRGDVVAAIDGRRLTGIDDLDGFLAGLEGRDRIELSVMRAGLPLTLQVEMP